MEIALFLIKSLLLPIIVTVVTFYITKYLDRKKEIPRLLLVQSEHGINPSKNDLEDYDLLLKGYYLKQRNLDEELKDFLKYNSYNSSIFTTKLLESIVIKYRNKANDTVISTDLNPIYQEEIDELVKCFRYNNEFMRKLKIYEAYMSNSKWEINITNVGKSNAFDLRIDQFPENYYPFKSYVKTLTMNDTISICLYYFDDTLRINEYSKTRDEKYEFGWLNNRLTKFYLVDSDKYNKKDERIFRISFKDCYTKEHEIYCCSKLLNSKDLIQDLRIKLDIEENIKNS